MNLSLQFNKSRMCCMYLMYLAVNFRSHHGSKIELNNCHVNCCLVFNKTVYMKNQFCMNQPGLTIIAFFFFLTENKHLLLTFINNPSPLKSLGLRGIIL